MTTKHVSAEIGSMWTCPSGQSYRLVGKTKSHALMGGPAPVRGIKEVPWKDLSKWKSWAG